MGWFFYRLIVHGKTQTHFWFLYLIIGLYLITPLLRIFTRYTTKKEYGYIIFILFIFTSVIATIKKVAFTDFGINIPINSVYVMYFLLGFYIHNYNVTFPNKVLLTVIFCFMVYTMLASLNEKMINPLMDNMIITSDKDSPVIILTATAIFITFRKNCSNFHFFDDLASLCFVMYLVHPFFIYTLYLFFDWTPVKYPLPLFLLVTILAVFVFSLGTSFCIHKIEYTIMNLKKIYYHASIKKIKFRATFFSPKE